MKVNVSVIRVSAFKHAYDLPSNPFVFHQYKLSSLFIPIFALYVSKTCPEISTLGCCPGAVSQQFSHYHFTSNNIFHILLYSHIIIECINSSFTFL
jgi:hypothetical protein